MVASEHIFVVNMRAYRCAQTLGSYGLIQRSNRQVVCVL